MPSNQSPGLARKEKVAIILLVMSVFTLAALIIMIVVFDTLSDFTVQYYECSLTGATIMMPFFALSTWFYNSNAKTARKHARIFVVIILLIYSIELLIWSLWVDIRYSYATVAYYFETEDVFDPTDRILVLVAVNLGRFVGVVLIILSIWLICKKIKKKK